MNCLLVVVIQTFRHSLTRMCPRHAINLGYRITHNKNTFYETKLKRSMMTCNLGLSFNYLSHTILSNQFRAEQTTKVLI